MRRDKRRGCHAARRRPVLWPLAAAILALPALSVTPTRAALCTFACNRPTPDASAGNVHQSTGAGVFDLGTRFLDRLGTWTTYGNTTGPANFNPEGGGGPEAQQQRFRAWLEGYGAWSRTDPQGAFAGDTRTITGGIAGFGLALAPGFNVGLSVDQGHTKVNVTSVPQDATIDLTQFGFNASYQTGSWTAAAALIHGFGSVHSTRATVAGDATASYGAKLWGAVAELNYAFSFGNSRIVPKIGLDWISTVVDPFTETGGTAPVSALEQSSRRTRLYAGAEIGHSWLAGTTIIDLGGYAKVVDVLSQQVDTLQFTAATGTSALTVVQGVEEPRFGLETGAALSVFLSEAIRLYAYYDGKFREGYQSHGATLGLEVKW